MRKRPANGKNIALSLFLTPEQHQQIVELAKEEDRSMASVIRRMITEALKARDRGHE